MKSFNLCLLLLVLLTACSSTETPEKLLQRVMSKRMEGTSYKESKSDGIITMTDEVKGLTSEGTWMQLENFTIVQIKESYYEDYSYITGIFISDEGMYKSVFESDLVKGKLDTIIDLNNDQKKELIITEIDYTTAGMSVDYVLYANEIDRFYVRVATIGHDDHYPIISYNKDHKKINSTLSFVKSEAQVLIVVNEERSWLSDENGEYVSEKAKFIYRWQPPDLVRELGNPEIKENLKRITESLEKLPMLKERLKCLIRTDKEKLSGQWVSLNAKYFEKSTPYYNSIGMEGEWFVLTWGDEYITDGRALILDITFKDSLVTLLLGGQAKNNPDSWELTSDSAAERKYIYDPSTGILDDGNQGWVIADSNSNVPILFYDRVRGDDSEEDSKYPYFENERLAITLNAAPLCETPDGKIIGTLPEGVKCVIINQGSRATINGRTGYWYEVDYILEEDSVSISGIHGWVFGPDTSKGTS